MADLLDIGKCYTKSRQWTQNELSLFVQVLVDEQEKFCHLLEELALKKKTNTELFQRIRKQFDAARREQSFHRQNVLDNFSGWVKYTELDTKVVKLRRKYSNLKQKWKMTADRIKHGSSLAPRKDPGWYSKLNEVLSGWHNRQNRREQENHDYNGSDAGYASFDDNKIINAYPEMTETEKESLGIVTTENDSLLTISKQSSRTEGRIGTDDEENESSPMLSIGNDISKSSNLNNDTGSENDSLNISGGVHENFKVEYLMDEQLNSGMDSEGSTTSDYDTADEHLFPNLLRTFPEQLLPNISRTFPERLFPNISRTIPGPLNWTEVGSPVTGLCCSTRRKRRHESDEEDRIADSVRKLMEAQEKRWKEYIAEERRRDQLFLDFKRGEAENERKHQIKIAEIFATMCGSSGYLFPPSCPPPLLRSNKEHLDFKGPAEGHLFEPLRPKSPEF